MLFKVSLGAVYVWTLFIKIHKEHACPCLLAIGEKRRWYVHQPLSHTWQHSSKCVVVSQASFIFEPVKQREGFLFKLQCCIGRKDCRELNYLWSHRSGFISAWISFPSSWVVAIQLHEDWFIQTEMDFMNKLNPKNNKRTSNWMGQWCWAGGHHFSSWTQIQMSQFWSH